MKSCFVRRLIAGCFILALTISPITNPSVAFAEKPNNQNAGTPAPPDLLRNERSALNLTEKERLWIQAHSTVKIVQYFHQPPFNIELPEERTGYLYDLLFEVLHLAGLRAEFVGGFSSYDAMIDALQQGRVDILTNINRARKLPSDIVRTVSVVKTPNALVGKIGAPKVRDVSDLFGIKVAVVKGYAQDQHLDRFPQIEKVHVRNNEEGFEAVRNDRAEYFLNNLANAGYILKKTFATDLLIAGTLSYVDFPPLELSFGVHGGDSPLPGIINKALAAVSIQTISDLQKKWLTDEVMPIDQSRILLTPEELEFIRAHPVIRVHNEQNWAPFNFFEHGAATGFSIDYMNLLAGKVGLRVEYISGPTWNEFLTMMKERRLDVMLNIVKTTEREKYIRFTKEPYLETPRAIVVREDDATVRTFADLYGRTVAVEKGFFYENYLKENHPEIKIMPVKNTVETLRAVANGDVDATLGVIQVEQFLINRHFFSNLKLVVDPGEKALRSFDQFIGVRSDWPQLAAILDKAMGAVTDYERVIISRNWIVQEVGDAKKIHFSQQEEAFLRAHPVLRVAFDVDRPPVESSDKDIGMKGMAADYLNRMGEILGVKFEPSRPRSWKEMIRAVENGELDFFSAMSPTPQRRMSMGFTESYLSFPIVILTDKQVPYIGNMMGLRNKLVAVVDGYASHDFLQVNHPELNLLPVGDVKEGLMAVSTGKAYAFVGSLAAASHVMSREGISDLKVSGETPYTYEISMAARKEDTVLLGLLQKGINAIRQDQRDAINSKWMGITYEHRMDYTLLIWIIGVAGIILGLTFFWNRRLKTMAQQLETARDETEAANKELARQALVDGLTQIANRFCFDEMIGKEWTRAARDQVPISLIICDVDHFKRYNDFYGHIAGDQCLITIAATIDASASRPADLAARYGGEEFAILLPNTDMAGAESLANKIQQSINALGIPHEGCEKEDATVTMSYGVATLMPTGDRKYGDLVLAADQALYNAKKNGRNRVEIADQT